MRITPLVLFVPPLACFLVSCQRPGDDSQPATASGSAPVVASVVIGPVDPMTGSILSAEVAATDADGDALVIHYAWTVDGVAAGEDSEDLNGATWFTRGQSVGLSVWASDAQRDSATVEADPVVIVNSPPSGVGVIIDPALPAASVDTLTCSATATDADDDELEWAFVWTLDGVDVGEGPTFAPVSTGTYTCLATADDGEATATGAQSVSVAAPGIDVLDPWTDPGTWVDPPVFIAGGSVVVHYAGALAGGAEVTLRYGFDGWWAADGVEQEMEEDSENQKTYYTDVAMSLVSAGRWEVTVDVPDGLRALHVEFTDGVTLDDNSGREWHGGTEFPYIAPYLSWNDEVTPRDGMVVSWENSTPSIGVVEYGLTEELGSFAVGDVVDTRHHVALIDLPQGARIYYRVYDNAGHASDIYSFLTLSDGEDSFTFLVAADMQDNGSDSDRWPAVAEAMLVQEANLMYGPSRFLLVPGDLASTDRPGHWWRYFEGGRDLFTGLPMLPVPGNHDTKIERDPVDYTSFAAWFDLPGEERYYTIDYGTVRAIGLDTETSDEQLYGGNQYLWAQGVLGTADPGWVIAYQHYSPYTVSVIPPNGDLDLQSITELYDGHLDWVITGHNHLNERYLPMRSGAELAPSGEYGRGVEDGVGYLVVPSAGDHPWEGILGAADDTLGLRRKVAYPEIPSGVGLLDGQHGWLQVDVAGSELHLQTWQVGDAEAPQERYLADEVVERR
ncbi:MAG: hypothetical protein EXR69_05200 [Myxococcales bacterium]|nr:hypothetical protein [Myxococcales bacterium]